MGNRTSSKHRARGQRCERCWLFPTLCFCDVLQPVLTDVRIVVVQHPSERIKPTNTARLAPLLLEGSTLVYSADVVETPDPERTHRVLFPSEQAEPVESLVGIDPPLTLWVPDGSWRQARRIQRRHPVLQGMLRCSLPNVPPSRYTLRKYPHDGHTSTLEAIAHTLGILEGANVRDHLLQALDVLCRQVEKARAGHTSAPRRPPTERTVQTTP